MTQHQDPFDLHHRFTSDPAQLTHGKCVIHTPLAWSAEAGTPADPHLRLQFAVAVALFGAIASPAWSVDCPLPAPVNNTNCTVPSGTTVTVNTTGATGLNDTGTLGQIIGDGITVNLGAATTTGAMALQGAAITFNGSTVSTTSIGAAANGQVGLRASGAGSNIVATGATLDLTPASGTSLNLRGAAADSGGVLTLNGTTVLVTGGANGTGNYGLAATGAGSRINFSGGSVSTSSRGAFGVLAESGGTVSLSNGAQISSAGVQNATTLAGSHALYSTGGGSQISTTGIAASTSGTNASVALADTGGTLLLTSSSFTNSGASNLDSTPNAGVRAITGGKIVMSGSGSTITTTGLRGFGLSIEGSGSQAQVADTVIQTSGSRAFGVSIKAGGSAQINNSSVLLNGATGPFTPAVQVEGVGSSLTLTNSSVTTTTPTVAVGVAARDGANVLVSDTRITTTGLNSAALTAFSAVPTPASVTANNITIITSGDDNAMGAIADLNGTITLNGGTITTTGNQVRQSSFAHALGARNPGGTLIANGTVVNTSGLSAMGAWSDDGGNTTLNDVRITTSGVLGVGLYAVAEQVGTQFNANTTANRNTVQTTGLNAFGVEAQSRNDQPVGVATVTVNDTAVTTQGTGAVGLRAILENYGSAPTGRGEANVVANRSTVQTQGVGAHGALSRDAPTSVTINQSSVQASGTEAHGAVALIGGRIIGTDATVNASGANSMALYALGIPGAVSTADFTRSTLTNTSGPIIGVAGDANITLINSTVTGASQWLRVGTLNDFPLLAASPPPLGGPADFPDELTGALPPLQPPPITAPAPPVSPGLANVTLSGSTVVGSAFTAPGSVSNLTLTNNSLWRMTGDSNLTTLVNDPSLIDFSAPVGGVFKTLTVNTYSGDGAIGLNTFLEGDGSPSDKLVIDGGTATALATGNTALLIHNARDTSGVLGRGALTTGNGILVVDALNGGTTSADAFRLGNRAVAGPYEYTLHRSSVDGSNSEAWYLRSTADSPSPTPTPDPSPEPNFRPETSLYGAIPALALVYSRGLIDTLHERVAEERRMPTDPLPKEHEETYGPSIGWGRMIFRNGEREAGSSGPFGNSPAYSYDMQAFQVGLDLYRGEDTDGSHDQAGLSLAVGNIDGGVKHYTGNGAGDNVLRAYSLGGYWTHFSPDGGYVDGVLQLHRFDIEAKPNDLGNLDTQGWGYTASLETGYPFLIDEGDDEHKFENLYLEPQAQLIYSRINLDNSDDIAADVRFKDIDSLIGRLGVRLAKDWFRENDKGETLRTNGWLRPSVWHEFKGQPKTEFSSANGFVPFEADIGGSWWEANLGVDYQADKKVTFYISAGYQKSFDGDSHSYEGMLGVKYDF
ncbi:autotransporter outer membrane beta-barrel domain-containing protein [Pseudomonas putida]|uniref:Autotransporter outer membrane beta-barrel domain-containing protein n=2 Tax=Pseudomonas putida TaxID=303 RepID=A0A2Z4RE73_PSEPU|nr:autotransporter outer membrane beta-barrel domain-containing protein [Pseudomonas putida]